jgi:5-methylcytosine-specific restriction endonuclease McrA
MNESSTPTKACTKCGVGYPATEEFFGRAKIKKSGLKGKCKSCINAYQKIYHADPDKGRRRIAKAAEWLRILSDPFKTCTECTAIKPATEEFFGLTTGTKSGLIARCKSCRSASNKTYYEQNFERISAYQKIYNKANSEKINASKKIYREANPEAARSEARRRKAQRLENGFEIYTEGQVLNLYGSDCYLCKEPIDLEISRKPGIEGWQKSLHIDHVMPMSKGGPDTLENVRPSHAECNLIKGTRTVQST